MNYLHEAVENDPADPMAYAGLAQGYVNLGHGPTPSHNDFLKAEAAALTAIKLDSTNAEAFSALGSVKLYHERDWKGAERAFQRANTLNPSLPLFPWAEFRQHKAAIKLHTLMDLEGSIPIFIHISDGRTHDVNVLDMIPPLAGRIYIMDRGYLDSDLQLPDHINPKKVSIFLG